MKNKHTLLLLTLAVIVIAGLAIYYLDESALSAYGSLFAAAGSFVAVIWFTGSLWYQAQQLKEQREQFLEQIKKTHEEGRRNALLLARDILNAAETRALALNPDFGSISQVFPAYLQLVELKDIMESEDPVVVQVAVESWLKKEGPALAIMKGLKSAAQVYFVAIGKNDVDYSKAPEEFVFVYGPLLWNLPFFEAFQATATMLAEFMVRLEPGRRAVTLASFGVMVALGAEKVLKMDSIRKDVEAHREKGYSVPKIAKSL